jgi:hypothetical protein
MAGLARRLAPAAALGGLAVVIVGVADPALAGRTDSTATGTASTSAKAATETAAQAPVDEPTTCANGETVTGGAAMT